MSQADEGNGSSQPRAAAKHVAAAPAEPLGVDVGERAWIGPDRLAQLTVALLVLVLYSASLAWGLNLDFSADRRGAILTQSGAHGMRSLPATLEVLSSLQADDPHEIPIDMVTVTEGDRLAPVLGWALRDFGQVRWVSDGILGAAAAAVVATESQEVPVGETYAGQDFPVIVVWNPLSLRGKALWRWLLYREAPAAPLAENVVLWVSTIQ